KSYTSPSPQNPDENSKFKRADKPLQTEVETSFNLKKIFDKVEEEKPVVENFENMPKEAFSSEELSQTWNEFLEKLKVEHKIPAYNALQSGIIELKDNFVVEFTFSSLSL